MPAPRRLGHTAVEAAIRAVVATKLKPQTDSMLRTFLAFKALHRDGFRAHFDGVALKPVVEELFTLLPTPPGVPEDKFSGTIALRGKDGRPNWLRNDSYRGSFLDYAGPTSPGRVLFEGEDWRKPLKSDAVKQVEGTLGAGAYRWPPRDALAAIALRNELLDPSLSWDTLLDEARRRFGLTEEEWEAVTSPPVLVVEAFAGEPWDPASLAADLLPPGSENAEEAKQKIDELPPVLAAHVERVLERLATHAQRAIVALAGVTGTSKSHVARIAARTFASEGCVREIQLSPGYTYEEFMEGPRYGEDMGVDILAGAFLELNSRALDEPDKQFVLLIEEFTRADLPRVLGELLTYVEYRDEEARFTTMYRRDETTRIAPNVAVLATYNPTDRSAVNVDAALVRRMRVLDFPPNMDLLREILADNGLDPQVIEKLVEMFEACREASGDRFDEVMPFGHAVFATVEDEKGLHDLWHEELKRMLVRPHAPRHELYPTIVEHFPWHAGPDVTVVEEASDGAGGESDS